MPMPAIDVAASVVQDSSGRVLLAERTGRQVSPGFWELPGGKIDPGETASEAAARELTEEVGIRPAVLHPWIAYEHAFPTKRIRLNLFRVERWNGTPMGREGQRLAWVDPAAPGVGPLLPSNERALLALGLPGLIAIADSGTSQSAAAALEGGVRVIVVSEPRGAPDQRVALARRVAAIAQPYGAHVLLEGSAIEARRAGVTGVLSSARDLRRLTARPPLRLWAAACHDASDLGRAVSLGADFALLAPVLADNEGEATPAGWHGLRQLAASTPIPVYAGGGMTPAMLAAAQRAGAAGVAVSLADLAPHPLS